MYCRGPAVMRAKTGVVMDSAEAGAQPRQPDAPPFWNRYTRHTRKLPRPGEKPPLTVGNVIHFAIAVFLLWPVFIIIAAIWSLGDAVNFIRHSVEACISSTFWMGRLCKEWTGSMYLHKNAPEMLRLRGQRKAFGHEAAKDWRDAGRALLGVGRAWSRTFGLGGLFSSLEKRIEIANKDWRRYVATATYDTSEAPADFPSEYIVVDELPRGGSSARLYVVRKAAEQNGPLYVLKYFNLRAGGNLESVVRESQAAQLAQKLGLIIESKLGDAAFWYVMPYYHGETLTEGVLRNIKSARENDSLRNHYRVSLGYVHQLLQIIAQYHEAGVFHKDIKPDNLIINGERIYLVDIGLMTPLGSMSQLTTHGTEYFRDPEMVKLALEGREVREVDASKFDVYSIGAVLFFAISGEFPTSGALSRLPSDAPLAVQWVVNRAMTGMHQRYDNARAMLTDIDFLSWAASQGTLEQVKPADLPSFRGMPVPPHLQGGEVGGTEFRAKLETAPGGYGAWYAAPSFKKTKREFGFGKAAAILFLVAGLAAIGVFTIAGLEHIKRQRAAAAAPAAELISEKLTADNPELRPVYEQIDNALRRGIQTDSSGHSGKAFTRIELAPALLTLLVGAVEAERRELLQQIRDAGANNPGSLFGDARVVLLSVDPDETDRELAQGIELDFELAAARHEALGSYPLPDEVRALRDMCSGVTDRMALHRELASRFATDGKVPVFVVLFTIEDGEPRRELHLRGIYPGREVHRVVPIQIRAD